MGNWYKNDPVVDGARQRIDKMEALALAAGIHEVPTLWLREKGGGSRVTTPSAKAESF
ncbi:hypothetical protein [Armatimonas sp.]|uniref:hypothetical protein n=1 Tax=Armatimonas sp. TaxID=1872638 RepID=UPI00375045A9